MLFRDPRAPSLSLILLLIVVMCVITEKKILQLNIARLCCHNFISLGRGGAGPPSGLRLRTRGYGSLKVKAPANCRAIFVIFQKKNIKPIWIPFRAFIWSVEQFQRTNCSDLEAL